MMLRRSGAAAVLVLGGAAREAALRWRVFRRSTGVVRSGVCAGGGGGVRQVVMGGGSVAVGGIGIMDAG